MKHMYDFSTGERGKFYRADATFSLPIYLEPDVDEAISRLAEEKGIDAQTLVNEWLRTTIKLVESVK